ncbi:hypothetical protein VTJ83DRAFT_4153 [Remersonia thermophila]|uniref:Cyclopropane-fatty-acyl-phospholipid synthase n=1 Tax=Remersonia thermophila TaxID=72144 RepID=A0ABR4D948_9PEZI
MLLFRVGLVHCLISFVSRVITGFSLAAHKVAIAIAKPAILSLLEAIEIGSLTLVDKSQGDHHVFGDQPDPDADPAATLEVYSPLFYLRVFLLADMGFAQSYLRGEMTCSDLTAFFRLFIANRRRLDVTAALDFGMSPWLSHRLLARAVSLARRVVHTLAIPPSLPNTAAGAAANIAAHYDLGNDMFAAFLSSDMTYSCPIWATVPSLGEERPNSSSSSSSSSSSRNSSSSPSSDECLESAQARKIRRLIAALRLNPADHILELGTGWGSFAIAAARAVPGCRVTTVTLSRAQAAAARERVAREGLEGRVDVVCADYRDGMLMKVKRPAAGFDKVVSVEMAEAVGREYLGEFFARVDGFLKREGGVAVVQCITLPEGRGREYAAREDFINHYIFPGGYVPSVTELINHITTASRGTLVVENIDNIGGHYARALRLWRERFLARFDDTIRPALLKRYPNMTAQDVGVFRRKWQYYFSYCEAGFLTKALGDVIITVAREGTMETMEGIPL